MLTVYLNNEYIFEGIKYIKSNINFIYAHYIFFKSSVSFASRKQLIYSSTYYFWWKNVSKTKNIVIRDVERRSKKKRRKCQKD